uniref:Major facilitator superfamily (MFS) profile domain-containing protein n=1 Tax=Arcella intermedia TaxID=1963864 RepID=A0A6B2L421_9EUKA
MRVYRWRWVMLLIIFLTNLANGSLWVTFAPIDKATAYYYDISPQVVNLLSIVFMVAYVPLGFVSQWFLDHKSFRFGVILGAWLTTIGAWLRYLSSKFFNHTGAGALSLLFAGQTLAAFAQPFLLNAPPKMATMWFSVEGRATADMVGTIGNILGVGVAQAISPILANIQVKNTTNGPVDDPQSMDFMLMIFAIICSVACVITTIGTREKPPSPPSHSAYQKATPFLEGIKQMYSNVPYLIVLGTFAVGLGVFNTMTTVLEEVVSPIGIDEDHAGYLGAIIVGVGLVTSGITAPILDKYHKYKELYVFAFFIAVASFVWFSLVMYFIPMPSFLLLSFPCATLGIAAFVILPTALELCIEITYPIAPATSVGFLWMMGQVVGIASSFACTALQSKEAPYSMQNSLWFMIAIVSLGCLASLLLLWPYRPTYFRLQSEHS